MKETNNIEQLISRLAIIKKDELSEREFFQAVLTEINTLQYIALSEDDCKKIWEILREIGCVDYKTWKEEKWCQGKIIKDERLLAGTKNGSLVIGAGYIGNFVEKDLYSRSYKHIIDRALTRTQSYSADPEGKANLFEVWLRKNKEIIDKYRTDEGTINRSGIDDDEWIIDTSRIDDEKTEERKAAIEAARERAGEKKKIQRQIDDIEKEIAELNQKLAAARARKEELDRGGRV